MPHYRFSGSLKAARWPLIAALEGRTVIQGQLDYGRNLPRFYNGSDESADLNVPQVIYMENVLPTAEGFMSVQLLEIVGGVSGAVEFDQAFMLRDAVENNVLFSPAGGLNYIFDPTAATWTSTDPIAATTALVTRAYVNGRTFVSYAGDDIYEYDGVNFLPVTITYPPGVVAADIMGVGASNNYLIIFTDITVYWSSLVDPTDFTPSNTTGAGYATPQDVKGQIISVQGVAGGYIIWTLKNAVAAQYTNNVRAPFAFKEIAGAGGIIAPERATQDTQSGAQYAWTTNGLQKVTLQGSEFVSAEVNDFIAGRKYSIWQAGIIDEGDTPLSEFYTKIALISNRWLCLSWGTEIPNVLPQFDWCLVYDLALKRWGNIKIQHTDVFTFGFAVAFTGEALTFDDLGTATFDDLGTKTFADLVAVSFDAIDPTSKMVFAFLKADGSIHLTLMTYNKTSDAENGVLILGKHQISHADFIQHQLTTVEGAYGDSFTAKIAVSQDGMNMEPAEDMYLAASTGRSRTYDKRISGNNFILVFEGTFALSAYVSEVVPDGDD